MSQTEVQLIKDAVIVNADVSNSAAIDVSKISGALPAAGGTITGDVTFDGETAGRDIVFDRSDNALEFADDSQIRIGTGNDLTIFHESSSNFNVFRQNNALSTKWLAGSDTVARFMTNGAVELYHDNGKRFETTSAGTKNTGVLDCTGSILLPDQSGDNIGKIRLGDGQDFEIYHDAGHSTLLDRGTGNLKLYSNGAGVDIQKSNGENMALFKTDGAVELYHDNSKKIETTSSGISVTGNASFADNGEVVLGSSSDLILRHIPGSRHEILGAASAQLQVRCDESLFLSENGNEDLFRAIKDGAFKAYFDAVLKLETTSDGTKTSGQIKQFSADGNTSFRRDVYYLAIPTNSSRTITLTSLNGTAVFRAGGYTNAGQGALALHVLLGGAMFATQHYQVNELINSGMQNTSISTSKNSTSYTMAITNSSNTFSLILQIYLESTGAAVGYAVS